jgi:hypothetical protein
MNIIYVLNYVNFDCLYNKIYLNTKISLNFPQRKRKQERVNRKEVNAINHCC